MNPMLKVSAAVLIAAMSVVPALAAVDAAIVVMGSKADIVPVTALDKLIGTWTAADIGALDKASTITVFDTRTLYGPADVKLVGDADTRAMVKLAAFRAALGEDAALKAWFAKNKLDMSRVIAISDTAGKVAMYLY